MEAGENIDKGNKYEKFDESIMKVIIFKTEIQEPRCRKKQHQDKNNIQLIIQPVFIHIFFYMKSRLDYWPANQNIRKVYNKPNTQVMG